MGQFNSSQARHTAPQSHCAVGLKERAQIGALGLATGAPNHGWHAVITAFAQQFVFLDEWAQCFAVEPDTPDRQPRVA